MFGALTPLSRRVALLGAATLMGLGGIASIAALGHSPPQLAPVTATGSEGTVPGNAASPTTRDVSAPVTTAVDPDFPNAIPAPDNTPSPEPLLEPAMWTLVGPAEPNSSKFTASVGGRCGGSPYVDDVRYDDQSIAVFISTSSDGRIGRCERKFLEVVLAEHIGNRELIDGNAADRQ